MLSQAKLILWGVFILVSIGCLYALYRKGYNAAEGKYLPILEAQQKQAAELELKNKETATKVVTQYKTRVETVVKNVEKIVYETPEVLKNETNNCTIGPGFISLHNRAAQSGTVSISAPRVNGPASAASAPAR